MSAKVVCHLETQIMRQNDYCKVPLSKVVYFKEHKCWSANLQQSMQSMQHFRLTP